MLDWVEDEISRLHDVAAFNSGNAEIDVYLKRFALRNHRRNLSKTYVACFPTEPGVVVGYYTLTPTELGVDSLPGRLTEGLPRYAVPAFRLARLGVTLTAQGNGLGQDLVYQAGCRALGVAEQVGGILLAVDAMSDDLVEWYRGYFGMESLRDTPRTLVVNLRTFASADRAAR